MKISVALSIDEKKQGQQPPHSAVKMTSTLWFSTLSITLSGLISSTAVPELVALIVQSRGAKSWLFFRREEKGEIRSFWWWAKCLSGGNIKYASKYAGFGNFIQNCLGEWTIHVSPTSISPVIRAFWEVKCAAFVESRDNPLKEVARKEKKLCHNDTHQKEGRYKEVNPSTSANFLPAEVRDI